MIRFFRGTILTALTVALLCLSAGAENIRPSWQPSSYGGGGRFTAIAIDPSDPRTVYIGSDVAGIFKSRDGGNHFELAGKGLEGFAVADIAVNPAPPHQAVALTDDGLYYSMNKGDPWVRISREISYSSRFFGSTLLLFTRNSLWIGTDRKGVFKLSLSSLEAPPQPVPGLETLKINGLTVWDGYLYAATAGGVYRLEGKIWQPQMKGIPKGAGEMTDIASSRNLLYLVEKQKGLFRWDERSKMWGHYPVPLQPQPRGYKSLLVHPNNPNVVFIGSHPENWPQQLFKSQDGGATWNAIHAFQVDPEAPPNWTRTLSGVEEMAFVPGSSQNLFLTDWWNLWMTSDTGERWLQKHRGLQNTCINDLKIHPRDRKILYLCTADNGLMISEDSGKRWRRAMNGIADGHAQEIEISEKDPSRIFLLMNPWHKKGRVYLYESRDSGATWRDIGFPVPVETLPRLGYVDGLATNVELDNLSDDTIYVGTNGYGVYKTVNGGKSWSQMNRGLTTPYVKGPGALRVHPKSSDTLFVSTQAGGIFKSMDGAGSWKSLTTGERFTFGLAIDPSKPSRMIAGCAGNTVLLSNDDGRSWQEILLPATGAPQAAVLAVAFSPRRPGLAMAGMIRYDVRAAEGLFVSTDGARTFQKARMDLPRVNINVITPEADDPSAGYIGFNGTGLFRVHLGEKP